jgi:hypothetical protein
MPKLASIAVLFIWFLVSCSTLVPIRSPQPGEAETPTHPVEALPTWTATVTSTPTPEPSPTSTLSPTLTATATPVSPAPLSASIEAGFTPRFLLQPGTPVGVVNFAQPELGCNWMGVGGQAFGLDDAPVTYLVVEVGGTLAGSEVSYLTLSGLSTVFGPGGFLIRLADRPIASDGTLWMQLFDLGGQPLTEKVFFPTFAECERNLILINFREISNVHYRLILPLIFKDGRLP